MISGRKRLGVFRNPEALKKQHKGRMMKTMKSVHSDSIRIPPEIAAECDAPNQAETFDRGVRAFLAVPKSAVLKEEEKAKRRKDLAKKSS